MDYFTGLALCRYEMSLCKRCFGCQRMERDDFEPQMKCGQAVMMAENEQMRMDEIRTSVQNR
jgi:hypothetical protein